MNRLRMTSAGSALCRRIQERAGSDRNRILLSDWTSVDWQSLTFSGERHRGGFVVMGKDAQALAARITEGLEEVEFDLGSAGFVAEIALAAPATLREDGAVQLEIEALTIED